MPHLYDAPMVPNLLPFSAAITTGGGPTPSNVAGVVAEPGFAAMLGLPTPPVPDAAVSVVDAPVQLIPQGKAPLLGLVTDQPVAPVEAADPDQSELAEPIAVPATPALALVEPVARPTEVAPAPSSGPGDKAAAAPTGPAVMVNPTAPIRPLTPADSGAPVADAATQAPVLNPAPVAEAPTEGPARPTAIDAPSPALAHTDGTVATGDGAGKSIPNPTPSVSETPVAPVKLAQRAPDPAPVADPQGSMGTVVDPVRKAEPPIPAQPKAIPTSEDDSVAAIDGPRKHVIGPVPTAPVETAPRAVEPMAVELVAVEPVAVGPDTVSSALLEQPAAQAEAAPEQVPTQPQPSVMASISVAPVTPATADAVTPAVPDPAKVETQATPAAPVALRVVEPAPAEIASDAPADDGAFDTLVAIKSDADADALRTTSDTGGDAMNRDGHRQSTPQPAAPAPAIAQAAGAPLPAFDPLAAAAAHGATHTGDPVATEHRARAAAIGEDVGIAIVRHADSGSGDVLVIRLDPAELGKIEVRLRMDEARQLSAEVTADQPATLDLLRRDSDNLTRALNDAGFRADDQSLRFDSRGFGQSDQHAQQGRRIASRAYLNDGDAANVQSAPTPVQVRSSGRVDLVA
ncbi:flagellar hook-length control protein FliK [Sphingomonas sp.]|uniref:flagellar hook-length control protein FliK n=1 Tax=Sphingomonas sp. TaxID=28214 RepID=UPI003BAB7920